jgi:hypothetical protein
MMCSITPCGSPPAKFRGVLGGDQDGVNALGFAEGIFHGHLAFRIGAQPGQGSVLADFALAADEFVREVDGQGHQGRGLIAGKAEHHALVAGADGFNFLRS